MSALSESPTILDRALRSGGERAAAVDRRPVTRRAALRALPRLLEQRADPEALREAGDTVLELRVVASGGGPETRFRLAISDGAIEVTRGRPTDALAWFAISLADMIRLVAGSISMWDLMADKRLDLGGEAFTAMRIPGLLGL